ncbi:MAG: putative polymerase ECF-subfamily sigma factor [Thermoleophilia bacterium]|nr:putative polymerase ECF-subfamily sigma factor [Thermoleophilia bacterium]
MVAEHLAVVHRVAGARVGPDAADDVAAETFSEAWNALSAGAGPRDSERAWLIGIAINRCRMHHRAEARWQRRRRRGGTLDQASTALLDDLTAIDEKLDAARAAAALLRALARLPDAERATVIVVAHGELTPAEAAEALGLPAATVRSHLFRARRKLAGAIADLTDFEELQP